MNPTYYFRQGGALPSFANPDLFRAPFSVHVQPPRTVWIDRQTSQPEPPSFCPRLFEDLLLPEWRARYEGWVSA